jgi:hypothetical protein
MLPPLGKAIPFGGEFYRLHTVSPCYSLGVVAPSGFSRLSLSRGIFGPAPDMPGFTLGVLLDIWDC